MLVFDEARDEVGVMMLHGECRRKLLRHRKLGGQVLRMQIVHHEGWFDPGETQLIGDGQLERPKRGRVLEIAEMDR